MDKNKRFEIVYKLRFLPLAVTGFMLVIVSLLKYVLQIEVGKFFGWSVFLTFAGFIYYRTVSQQQNEKEKEKENVIQNSNRPKGYENLTMKKAIIIVMVLVAFSIGIFVFYISPLKKNRLADRALTIQLSPVLLKQLEGKNIYDFPYNPAPVEWEGKYLQVDDGIIFEEIEPNPPLFFVYNKKRNEKLNTDRFFPGNDIKGIVYLLSNSKEVGEYSGGGRAWQPCYVLYYLDLEKEIILAQDTIWGGMPPQTIGAGAMGGTGKRPKEEEVIKTIQQTIKNAGR